MGAVVRCFPRSDLDFCDRVAVLVDPYGPMSQAELDRLVDDLRTDYPEVIVLKQHPLATLGPPIVYVYRDGHALEYAVP